MIVIAPWAKRLRNGKENPKNYPIEYWQDVIKGLKERGIKVIQIGLTGERLLGADEVMFDKNWDEIVELAKSCETWISIDSFFQHLGWYLGKKGIVLFSKSNPKIYGHEENINLLKDVKYLRQDQFNFYEDTPYEKEAFVEPSIVLEAVDKIRGVK